MELERFSAKEQAEGSSPSVPISPKAEKQRTKIKVPSFYPSSLISHLFRGRLTGRTADFESVNRGSNPLPEVF